MNEAIKKLQTEIDANKSNPAIAYTGEYLIKYIENNPESAEKTLADDKTIAKAIDEIRKVASTRKVGNCAVIAPDEGLEIVLKYFGIDRAPEEVKVTPAIPPIPQPEPTKSATFDISLDDLL